MNDQQTCGQGLAAHATLPAQLGRLTAANGAVLETHLAMLDVTDPLSAREHAVYAELILEYGRAAQLLTSLAERMTGARSLPMGRHLDNAAANAAMGHAFAGFVEGEEALLALLQDRLRADRQMLSAMRGDSAG